MAVVVKDRTCRQCGATFMGGPRAWYCPSCRLDRQREQSRQHKRTGPSRPLGSTDKCKVCGADYVVESGRQMYCKACAAEAIREVDNRQSREWNAENATPEYRRALRDKAIKPRFCVICGKEFRPKDASITCSKDCSNELRRRNVSRYGAEHRDEINARKREARRQKLAAMTPEELSAYREKTNARNRENARKRKEQNN